VEATDANLSGKTIPDLPMSSPCLDLRGLAQGLDHHWALRRTSSTWQGSLLEVTDLICDISSLC
jgi:hypothetical protein